MSVTMTILFFRRNSHFHVVKSLVGFIPTEHGRRAGNGHGHIRRCVRQYVGSGDTLDYGRFCGCIHACYMVVKVFRLMSMKNKQTKES